MESYIHTNLVLNEYFKNYSFPKELIQFIAKLYYESFPIKIKIAKYLSILLINNKVYTWGDKNFDRINNDRDIEYTPQEVNLKNINQIAVENYRFMAINDCGDIYSWGLNDNGELGLDHEKNMFTPQKINLEGAKKIQCYGMYNTCVTKNGKTFGWGVCSNDYSPSPWDLEIENTKKIICRESHFIALNNSGEVYTWGINKCGNTIYPTKINLPSIKQIASTDNRCMVLAHSGEVYIWEDDVLDINNLKKISWESIDHRQKYVIVPKKLNLNNIKKIYCDNGIFVMINYEGEVYLWENLKDFRFYLEPILINNENRDYIKMNLTNIKKICFGEDHMIYLNNNGEVHVYGQNYLEQLGLGYEIEYMDIPEKLILPPVKKIHCGDNYSIAITYENNIYVWGDNINNILGVGHDRDVIIPTKIIIPK